MNRLHGGAGGVVLELEPLEDVAAMKPGVEQTVRARVVIPEAFSDSRHVSVEPAEVSVTFTGRPMGTCK